MSDIKLITPSIEHEAMALDFINEHRNYNEPDIHGGSMLERQSYYSWLKQLEDNSSISTVSNDWVTTSVFFAIRENDNKIIGIIDIRNYLNDYLAKYAGHIGYSIRPSERKKGYATQILGKGLEYCKSIDIDKVMLVCDKGNEASRKTIQKYNGIFEREFLYPDEHTYQVFWINL